jgi:hypothetical protein
MPPLLPTNVPSAPAKIGQIIVELLGQEADVVEGGAAGEALKLERRELIHRAAECAGIVGVERAERAGQREEAGRRVAAAQVGIDRGSFVGSKVKVPVRPDEVSRV